MNPPLIPAAVQASQTWAMTEVTQAINSCLISLTDMLNTHMEKSILEDMTC